MTEGRGANIQNSKLSRCKESNQTNSNIGQFCQTLVHDGMSSRHALALVLYTRENTHSEKHGEPKCILVSTDISLLIFMCRLPGHPVEAINSAALIIDLFIGSKCVTRRFRYRHKPLTRIFNDRDPGQEASTRT